MAKLGRQNGDRSIRVLRWILLPVLWRNPFVTSYDIHGSNWRSNILRSRLPRQTLIEWLQFIVFTKPTEVSHTHLRIADSCTSVASIVLRRSTRLRNQFHTTILNLPPLKFERLVLKLSWSVVAMYIIESIT